MRTLCRIETTRHARCATSSGIDTVFAMKLTHQVTYRRHAVHTPRNFYRDDTACAKNVHSMYMTDDMSCTRLPERAFCAKIDLKTSWHVNERQHLIHRKRARHAHALHSLTIGVPCSISCTSHTHSRRDDLHRTYTRYAHLNRHASHATSFHHLIIRCDTTCAKNTDDIHTIWASLK